MGTMMAKRKPAGGEESRADVPKEDRSGRRSAPIQIEKDLARMAAMIATYRGVTLSDMCSPVLRPFNEQVDRRRSKRILTDAEFVQLVDAAERCPPRVRADFSGPDRAMLYRVAAGTGLRAGDLASLTPACFALDAAPPTVTVDPKHTKGKRDEPVPLPAWLVERLRPWLAGRTPGERLWPGTWAAERRQHVWVARDVKRAGIAERDDRGRNVTFHSLKRRYVTTLIRAGAKVHEVRRLARHKDVRTTLDYYTDETLADLGRLADKLPPG